MPDFSLKDLTALTEQGKDKSLSQQAKIVSAIALPFLNDFIVGGGLDALDGVVEDVYGQAGGLSDVAYAVAAVQAQMVSRDQIKDGLKKAFAGATYEKTLEGVKEKRALISSLTQKEHIALDRAINGILPPAFARAIEQFSEKPGQSIEENVRSVRAKLKARTDAQLAQEEMDKKAGFPIDLAADAIVDTLSKVTPQSLKTLVDTFTAAVTADDAKTLLHNGTFTARAAMEALNNGTNLIQAVQQAPQSNEFKTSLTKALAGLEGAVVAAGLMPDLTAIAAHMKKGSGKPTLAP